MCDRPLLLRQFEDFKKLASTDFSEVIEALDLQRVAEHATLKPSRLMEHEPPYKRLFRRLGRLAHKMQAMGRKKHVGFVDGWIKR